MRQQGVKQLQPLIRQATEACQTQCSGRCYAAQSYVDAVASRCSAAHAPSAAVAARAESGQHATTSGRHLASRRPLTSSSRAYSAAAGNAPRPTLSAHAPAAPCATGLAHWGTALRPLAQCGISRPWHFGRQPVPYSDGGSARGFASQPIGRITPEGFTEKAWEVWHQIGLG